MPSCAEMISVLLYLCSTGKRGTCSTEPEHVHAAASRATQMHVGPTLRTPPQTPQLLTDTDSLRLVPIVATCTAETNLDALQLHNHIFKKSDTCCVRHTGSHTCYVARVQKVTLS